MNKDIQKHISNRLDNLYQPSYYDTSNNAFKRRVQAKDRLARQLGFFEYSFIDGARSYCRDYWGV